MIMIMTTHDSPLPVLFFGSGFPSFLSFLLSESNGWDCCTSNQSFAKEMPEYEHAY